MSVRLNTQIEWCPNSLILRVIGECQKVECHPNRPMIYAKTEPLKVERHPKGPDWVAPTLRRHAGVIPPSSVGDHDCRRFVEVETCPQFIRRGRGVSQFACVSVKGRDCPTFVSSGGARQPAACRSLVPAPGTVGGARLNVLGSRPGRDGCTVRPGAEWSPSSCRSYLA